MALYSGSSVVLWRSIACVSVVWWMSNLFAVIASKNLMKGADISESPVGVTKALSDMRWLELTAAQHLMGSFVTMIWLQFRGINIISLPFSKNLLIAAFANAAANAATNASFSVVSSAITQIVKSFEPISTFAFTCLLNKNSHTLRWNIFFSIAIMVTGSCMFICSDSTFNIWGIGTAILSNIFFPIRNILLKSSEEKTLPKYVVISLLSSIILLPILAISELWSVRETVLLGSPSCLLSALFHCFYNLASFQVLETVSPLTHAVLNMGKRLSIIVINLVFFNHAVSSHAFIGFFSFCVGLVLYTIFTRAPIKVPSRARSPGNLLLAVYFVWLLQNAKVERSTRDAEESQHFHVSTAWIYDQPVPSFVISNVRQLHNSHTSSVIDVFCGTNTCVQTFAELKNPSVQGTFVRTNELFSGTPLIEWQQNHTIHKVLVGSVFEHHLQMATELAVLWRFGGIYISPWLSCSKLNLPSKNVSSWFTRSLLDDINSDIMDLVFFQTHHPLIWELMEMFVEHYPQLFPQNSAEKSSRNKWPAGVHFDTEIEDFNFAHLSRKHIAKNSRHVVSVLNLTTLKLSSNAHGPTHHYGILSFDARINFTGIANLGDEIQCFSGLQFLPYSDRFLDREKLRSSPPVGNTTVFLNAWWGDPKTEWPPPDNVHPLSISMHFDPVFKSKVHEHTEYFKKQGPIGARDYTTLTMFQSEGIDTFFSGCLTLMLKHPCPTQINRNDKIYMVDLRDTNYRNMFPKKIQDESIIVGHDISRNNIPSLLERYQMAHDLIRKYSEAKLVITQRIHCALPCVAMGTPVIFLCDKKLFGGATTRTKGLLDLFHTIDLTTIDESQAQLYLKNFDWDNPPPNPNHGKVMRIRATFWNIIRQNAQLKDTAFRFGVIPFKTPKYLACDKINFHLVFALSELNCSTLQEERCSMKWYQWRSLESVLYHHPYNRVYIHSVYLKQSEFDVLTDVGFQVKVINSVNDLPDNLKFKLQKAVQFDLSLLMHKYIKSIFPLAIVYVLGGVYLRNDVLVTKSMDNVPMNSFVSNNQDNNRIEFLKFSRDHKILKACLDVLINVFSQQDSPEVTTACAEKYTKNITLLHSEGNIFQLDTSSAVQKRLYQKHPDEGDTSFTQMTNTYFAVRFDGKMFEQEQKKSISDKTLCKRLFNSFCVLCDVMY